MTLQSLKAQVESYFGPGKVTKKTIEKAFHDGKFDNDLDVYKNVEMYLTLDSKGMGLYQKIQKICRIPKAQEVLLYYKEYIVLWNNVANVDENGYAINTRKYSDLVKTGMSEYAIYELINDDFYRVVSTYCSIWGGGEQDCFDIPLDNKKKTSYKSTAKMRVGQQVTFKSLQCGVVECGLEGWPLFVPEKVFFDSFKLVGISYFDKDMRKMVMREV